jgi:hypothetical protein
MEAFGLSMRSRAVIVFGVTASILSLSHCNDVQPTQPQSPRARSFVGSLPGTVTFVVGAGATSYDGGSNGGIPWTPTGAVLGPLGTTTRVKASGNLNLGLNGFCYPASAYDTFDHNVTPYGVTSSGFGRVNVAPTNVHSDTQWSGFNGYYTYFSGSATTVAIDAMRKDLTNACAGVDNTISYTYGISGSTTLTIDVLGIQVSASTLTVALGQSVHFTASAVNFPMGSSVSWAYVPDDGSPSISVSACANLSSCDYSPTVWGQMTVATTDEEGYWIGGNSEPLTVIRCPTGDSILDNGIFRRAFLQAEKDSWADSLPFSRRREVGGYAYFDSTGIHVIRTEDPTKYSPCSISYAKGPGAVLIFHVHPFNPPEGFTPADTLPGTAVGCPVGQRYDVKTWGGQSAEDWNTSITTGLPSYVIDKKRIYVTNPKVTNSALWADSTKKYDWNTRKCRW